MRYRLRTLIVLLIVAPPVLAWVFNLAPREIQEFGVMAVQQLVPTILTAIILGLWAKAVFWLCAQVQRSLLLMDRARPGDVAGNGADY